MAKTNQKNSGKLKIGDNWNAISIIALSQSNPLKAIAEFVENSIDAQAKHIKIVRGKHRGDAYIKVIDDGLGIDDFHYVATHIGDSLKRQLKKQGHRNIQGEFGIGLLSFWTVGVRLEMTSTGSDGITRRMQLVKKNPGYTITEVRDLFGDKQTGTELHITPILSGIRQLSGEKIQNYLASELRDRITKSGVEIRIIDRRSRKKMLVEPRKFAGQLIHNLPLPESPLGEVYCELYINDPSPQNQVGLYRHGTRVMEHITSLEAFSCHPWNSDLLEGIIDVSFLQLTPGTRTGIVLDDAFDSLLASLEPVQSALESIITEQKRAEEEKTSKSILKRISKAMREALHFLPSEEYGWLKVHESIHPRILRVPARGSESVHEAEGSEYAGTDGSAMESIVMPEPAVQDQHRGREFFEFPGPLHTVMISPSSAVISVDTQKTFLVQARDSRKRTIEDGFSVTWELTHNLGSLSGTTGESVDFSAFSEPGVEVLIARITQGDVSVTAEATITITKELFTEPGDRGEQSRSSKGLPGYSFRHAPGELWRSTYDPELGVIYINNGHADYLFASRSASRKLRYIAKLYAKELVIINFPEADREKLLERLIELQLYTEENL